MHTMRLRRSLYDEIDLFRNWTEITNLWILFRLHMSTQVSMWMTQFSTVSSMSWHVILLFQFYYSKTRNLTFSFFFCKRYGLIHVHSGSLSLSLLKRRKFDQSVLLWFWNPINFSDESSVPETSSYLLHASNFHVKWPLHIDIWLHYYEYDTNLKDL